MKNMIRLWNGTLGGLFLLLSVSCTDFIEVPLPDGQLTAEGIFEEPATAHAAMTSVYSQLRDGGLLTGAPQGLSCLLGTYTDELVYYGSNQGAPWAFYNNALLPTTSEVAVLWNSSYQQIYAANAVLEGVEAAATLPVADRQQLTGEALFVRALLHTYLAQLYDGVPYIRTTDYRANAAAQRLDATEVLEEAKADLMLAAELLPEAYVTPDRVRPNRYAARAVLARICLYLGQWDEAGNHASAVLNRTELYPFQENLDGEFLADSPSTIWQFSPASGDANTREGATFIFSSGPPPLVALRQELVDAFAEEDLRKQHWIRAVTDGTDTWYHAFKYKQHQNGGVREHSVLLRQAELYLIRAEARARGGDLIGAREDLDRIRNRAGLGPTTALTAEDMVTAIHRERQMELFTELGHRYFDLRRLGTMDTVLEELKPGWESDDALFPIPETELGLNPNLVPQNPGY